MVFFFFFSISLPFSNLLPKFSVLTKAPKAVYPASCEVNSNQVSEKIKEYCVLSHNIQKYSWPHHPKIAFRLFFFSFLKSPDFSWQRWIFIWGTKKVRACYACCLLCSWYPLYPGLQLLHLKGLRFLQIICQIVQLWINLSDVLIGLSMLIN